MSQDEKVRVRISDVLEMLKNGKTRKDIAEHYGLSQADVKRMFQHPELKGKKTIKPVEEGFILEDDVNESQAEMEEAPDVTTEDMVANEGPGPQY